MTDAVDGESSSVKPSIDFIVTGFGPFHGVSENPTKTIVENLVEYLSSSPSFQHLSRTTRVLLLETSAQAVSQELDVLYEHIAGKAGDSSMTVLLHLGVNYCGTEYQLESCAYNNATFRVPDEQGFQPQRQCIIAHSELEECLTTRLDVLQLVSTMNATESTTSLSKGHTTLPSCKARESTDPGRFVCNYAYCYSLDKFQSHGQCDSSFRSLFLHVPPTSVASIAEQLAFVSRLMNAIHAQLLLND